MWKKYILLLVSVVMFVHGLLNIASSGWILMIIGALLFLLYWKAPKKKSQQKNSIGEDLSHLTPEEELPFGWVYEHKDFVDEIENEYRAFSDAWFSTPKTDTLKQYAALKSLVLYMEDVKKLCDSKGECFAKWASIMVADPVLLERRKEELKYIENNIDKLLQEEKRWQYIENEILPNLQKNLCKLISGEPGIIQATMFKQFDSDLKQYIQAELYAMEQEGLITREKCGRSYKIFLN